MPPARLLRSATKALHNSIADTAASSANLLCETFDRFFLRMLRNSNWSVVSELSSSSPSSKDASRFEANRTRTYVVRCSWQVVGYPEVYAQEALTGEPPTALPPDLLFVSLPSGDYFSATGTYPLTDERKLCSIHAFY